MNGLMDMVAAGLRLIVQNIFVHLWTISHKFNRIWISASVHYY
jgi:hypothetical protein